MKQYVFKEVKKFKIQRNCKGCGSRIVVDNANRYYCIKCRGYWLVFVFFSKTL